MGQVEITKVVVDTNVVVSGLLFGGPPGEIYSMWQNRRIQPFASKSIIDEYIRVLAYPKLQLSQEEIEYLLYQEILPNFEIIEPRSAIKALHEDPSDDMFIHCALAKSIPTIISGDRHLLGPNTFRSITILSPADFLHQLHVY